VHRLQPGLWIGIFDCDIVQMITNRFIDWKPFLSEL
jgi:hypothetical protein